MKYMKAIKEDLENNRISREQALRSLIDSDLADVLIDKGFTTVPASIKYHGNYEGGLFDHSFEVAYKLCELTENLGLVWERNISPLITGLFHDMCKIDNYEKDKSDILTWGYSKKKPSYPGHGVKSVLLIDDFGVDLKRDEKLCILHHMGAYEKDMWDEYGKAVEECENVLWTHTADMWVSRVKGL